MSSARASFLGIVAILLWSTNSAATVRLVHELGPLTALALVSAAAGVFLALVTDLRHRRFGAFLRIGWRFGLVGGTGFLLYQVLFFAAFALAGADLAVPLNLVNYLWPTLIVVLCVVRDRAGHRVRLGLLTIGIAAGLAGIAVSICPPGGSAGLLESLLRAPWAFLAMSAAATSWAVYSVVAVPMRPADGASGTPLFFLLTAGLAWIGRISLGETSLPTSGHAPLLAYTALVPAAGSYLLWELAMGRGNVPLLGALGNALPLLSTLVLWVVGTGQETDALRSGGAALLVCLGAVLVHRGARRRDAPA